MSVQQTQHRGITSSKWALLNPILGKNEFALESDTNKVKLGDGVSHWLELPYYVFKEVIYFLEDTDVTISQQHGTLLIKNINQNTTFIDGMASGESVTMHITMAQEYVITFPSCHWISIYGDTPPNLTNADVIIFWKILDQLYGSYIGSYDHAIV